MHQRGSETPETLQQSPAAAGLRAELAGLIRELAAVAGPTEDVFLRLGHGLTGTVGDLQRIEADFAELSAQIDGADAIGAVQGIERAVAGIAGLPVDGGEEGACLGRLAANVGVLSKRLAVLRGVAGEVGVLAMNAKIQASQLTVGAADFQVFTVEMTRLAGLAQDTIDRAGVKVAGLAAAIGRARADEEAFARSSGAELAELRQRLGEGARVLAERRQNAAVAANAVRERSRGTAAHVADSIGQLQINDITSQRIEHVRQALEGLDGLLAGPESGGAEDAALAAAVCRLQQAQLERTGADYGDHVETLVGNLRLMAGDTRAILDQAGAAFSDGSGGRASFAGQLEADIERATRLLDGFIAARARVREVMEAVHASVTDIVQDLGAVASIDADMQVMGLNATLKCGRLGSQGRALAVIAQELRGCGKRTEDNARTVSALLAEVTGIASTLRRMADATAGDGFSGLRGAMAESMARLDALAARLDGALARLAEDGGGAARTLDGLAGGVTVHHDVGAVLRRISGQLAELGGGGESGVDAAAIRDRLRDLLAGHYTMASERLVHQLAAEDDLVDGAGAAPAEADIDDCFL